jgi:hypothetical protein
MMRCGVFIIVVFFIPIEIALIHEKEASRVKSNISREPSEPSQTTSVATPSHESPPVDCAAHRPMRKAASVASKDFKQKVSRLKIFF